MNLNDALTLILSSIKNFPKEELVHTSESLGRILAIDLKSKNNIPSFDNSQVDGYAVNSGDSFSKTFSISQRIPAGSKTVPLLRGTTARIFTGAMVPKNSDAIVMQEDIKLIQGRIKFSKKIKPGQNIRKKGGDLKKNQTFFKKGRFLSAADVGMCSSVGIKKIKIYKKLKVGVFSSGDELKQPGEALSDGQIYDSNRPMIISLVRALNFETIDMGCIPDNLSITKKLLFDASKKVDAILTCGGVSVGEEDHIKAAVESLGSVDMWKINIKPGKPFAFGSIGNSAFLGMPGNPVSAWVTFALLCRPFLIKLAGGRFFKKNFSFVESDFNWLKESDRLEFIRGKILANGKLDIFENQNSQILSSICFSDGLIEVPVRKKIKKGDKVKFYPFSEIS